MRLRFAPACFLLISVLACAVVSEAGGAAEGDPRGEPAVQAVGKVLPAVVNINTERTLRRDGFDPSFDQYYGGGTRKGGLTARPTVQSLGSGFLVNADGYIVTNEHVVERAADLKIWVTLSNKQTYEARYVTGSQQVDLAFIKIDSPEPLPFISLDDLSPSLLGQTVLVLGNPLGFGSSVSRGIVSGKGRTVTMERATYTNLLQTDAAINPGNSGGPVIDLSGKLVGVSSVKMAQTKQGIPTQGMGFAIEAETVRQKVAAFMRIAQGLPPAAPAGADLSYAWKYLGVQLEDLTQDQRRAMSIAAKTGVLVAAVDPGSPAAEAGFSEGLVIFQVGKYEVGAARQIEELLAPASAGSVIDLTIGLPRRSSRGSSPLRMQLVTLTAR